MSKEKEVSEAFKRGSNIKQRIKDAWDKAEKFFEADEDEDEKDTDKPSKLDSEKGRKVSESFIKKRFKLFGNED